MRVRRTRSRLAVVLLGLSSVWMAVHSSLPGQEAASVRGRAPVAVEPLKREAPSTNAGVFIGVNEFTKDQSIGPLDFAVNDAVALAHLGVVELKLIPAERCVLCLSGQPTADRLPHLEKLKSLGAEVIESATKSDMLLALGRLKELKEQKLTFNKSSLILVAVSSHGLNAGGVPYVVPSDGVRAFLRQTALDLPTIEDELSETKAGHRLLLIDACQEKVPAKNVGRNAPQEARMDSSFGEFLKKPTGQIKVASCKPGELSYEDRASGQGAFTNAVLLALRGAAVPREDNIVDLEAVLNSAKIALAARNERQSLFVNGEESARKMPLAIRASDTQQLVALLKTRINKTGFKQSLFDQLATLLSKLDSRNVPDQELLEATRDFTAGRMKEFAFVAVLKERFNASRPVPSVETPTISEDSRIREGSKAGDAAEFTDLKIGFRWCPAGSFQMGSPDSDTEAFANEKPQVDVTLTRGFWLGRTEVTQGQWKPVMNTAPWSGKPLVKEGTNYPATYVSHGLKADGTAEEDSAEEFCRKLTQRERAAGRLPAGWKYRLPTEAEWEYACRAGQPGKRYSFGDDASSLSSYGWFGDNAEKAGESYAHEVGGKSPNPWGLRDMHGNVWEWCSDWYGDTLPGGTNPLGPSEGSDRVFRGGSWFDTARGCRSANRGRRTPSFRYNFSLGFRLAV